MLRETPFVVLIVAAIPIPVSADEQIADTNVGNQDTSKSTPTKEGDDWNDFGYRHCPFCGLVTDEYANIS